MEQMIHFVMGWRHLKEVLKANNLLGGSCGLQILFPTLFPTLRFLA